MCDNLQDDSFNGTIVEICRTCLSESIETKNQISIFDIKEINDECLRLADMLNLFTNLEFKAGDNLPTKICNVCAYDISHAFEFRQRCLNTDTALRKKLITSCVGNTTGKREPIKLEPQPEIDDFLLENSFINYEENHDDGESENEDEIETNEVTEQNEKIPHEIVKSEENVLESRRTTRQTTKSVKENYDIEEFDDEDVEDEENEEDYNEDGVKIDNAGDTSNTGDDETTDTNANDEIRRMNNRLLVHKCPTCKKGFDRQDKMKRHAKIHDVPENKYYCQYCNKGYKMLQTYKSHMKSHDPNNSNRCSFCNSIFSTIYELERHVRIHTGEKPFKCDECEKGFAQRNGLVRHLVNFHKKDIGYSQGYGKTPHKKKPCLCEVCGVEKKNAFALKIHMRQHTGEKPHRCEICGKGFVVPFQLKMHMRSHTGEKPHQCDLCEKSFSQRIGLEVHRRTHTGEKPCVCDICEKAFTVPSHLKMHMRSHTGEKPYKCDVCFKGFTQNTILQNHMKSHTGNTFNCVFCTKGFNQKHNLKRHMKIHTGEKPFECAICNRRFSEKLSMKYHVQTHSGEKPYSKLAARLKARKLQDQVGLNGATVPPQVLINRLPQPPSININSSTATTITTSNTSPVLHGNNPSILNQVVITTNSVSPTSSQQPHPVLMPAITVNLNGSQHHAPSQETNCHQLQGQSLI